MHFWRISSSLIIVARPAYAPAKEVMVGDYCFIEVYIPMLIYRLCRCGRSWLKVLYHASAHTPYSFKNL